MIQKIFLIISFILFTTILEAGVVSDTINLKKKDSYIEPSMVLLKSGKFRMGSNKSRDEKPIHLVKIKKSFYISKYEVTFAEYDLYCESTGKIKPADSWYGRGAKPVINVSYNDALGYIKWLNKKSGRKYRLLSEEEWEYAARADGKSTWCFGSNKSDLKDYAWYTKNTKDKGTKKVGTRKPNRWNIYDMHGNVWEWTSSWYSKNYNQKREKKYKVLRGGSWVSNYRVTRSANRGSNKPTFSCNVLGFRLARTAP